VDTWAQLARVYVEDVSIAEFEAWLYASETAAGELGPHWYAELLEFNYLQPNVRRELGMLIERMFAARRPPGLEVEIARALATGFLAGRVSLHDAARQFAGMHSDHPWVPASFLYVDDEIGDLPHPNQYANWDPTALAARLKEWEPRLAVMHADARAACEEVLKYLDGKPVRSAP